MTIVLRKKKRSTLSTVCSRYGGSHHWDFGVSADKVAYGNSYPNVYLSGNLVTGDSYDFAGGTIGAWGKAYDAAMTLAVVGGALQTSGNASTSCYITYSIPAIVPGKTYLVEWNYGGTVSFAGNANVFIGTPVTNTVTDLGGGKARAVVVANGTQVAIRNGIGIGVTTTYDNISIREIAYASAAAEFLAAYPTHNLFQDAAGTLPAYAITHPVGLCLDQPTGAVVLGANISVAGTLDTPAQWAVASPAAGASIGGGVITFTGGTATTGGMISASEPLVLLKTYQVTLVIRTITAGRIQVRLGAGLGPSLATSGTHRFVVQCLTDTNVRIYNDGYATEAVVEGYEIREITGAHASQSNSLKMPRLSARVNQFTATEDFSNAAWVKTNTTFATGVADPRGGTTAITITSTAAGGLFYQLIANTVGVSSCWMRRRTGVGAVQGFNSNSAAYEDWALTSSWQRLSKTGTSVTSQYMMFKFLASGDAIDIWHPDLRPANSPTNLPAYQRVTSATDYDTVGFPVRAVWDGVDDCLVVPTLDLSLTDKVTVVYGYSMSIPTADAILLELSARYDINNGSFNQFVTSANKAQFGHRANSAWAEATSATLPTGTYRSVTSVAYDLSGTSYSAEVPMLKVNGAPLAATFTGSGNTGSGNFGAAYPLYIGQRAGTSFPFNGPIQSITLIPALITDAEIAIIENSVNTAMGKVY